VSVLNKLVSVSGCGHSGTTLTATVLGAHEKLLLIPIETRMFLDGFYDIDSFILDNSDKEFEMVIEKTPNHIYVIDKIKLLYPETKFIANIRDPRDIAASLYKRYNDWDVAINRLKKDLEYMKKFYDDIHVVRYEEIVGDFENTFKKICTYLDIEFDKKMLKYHEYSPNWFGVEDPKKTIGFDINGMHESNRAWQVKQPLFNGTGRWEKELNPHQLNDISKNLGDLSSFFGYTV
jgi:protein O-GlcNAc transferase